MNLLLSQLFDIQNIISKRLEFQLEFQLEFPSRRYLRLLMKL